MPPETWRLGLIRVRLRGSLRVRQSLLSRIGIALAVVALAFGGVAGAQPAVAPVAASVPSASIAVRPFINVSGHPDDAWIGGGIAESVSVDLRGRGLTVLGSMALGRAASARAVPLAEGATDSAAFETYRRLGARLLIDGTYQRLGDQLRITTRIVDLRSGTVLERAKVDGTLADLFGVQDRLADTLAALLADTAGLAPSRAGAETLESPPGDLRSLDPDVPARATDTTGAITLPALSDRTASGGAPVRRPGGGFAIAGRPTTTVTRTAQPPSIDGRLDDAVWRLVVPITQFVQTSPAEGAPATEDTEVWIAYDSENIYVAAYAHYKDTNTIRANRAERDETRGDDQIQVMFDPFLDQQRAYLFSVNGYGVAGDAIVNASGGGGGGGGGNGGGGGGGAAQSGFGIRGDSSWDALFETRGGLVADGWTAEMVIPFKSLRYPARSGGDAHTWGFQISRNIRDKSESLVWSPVSRNIAGQLTQMGVMDGMTNLSTSRNLEILPTFTGVQVGSLNTATGAFGEGDPLGQMGLGVKYGVTSNLTLDFTYNPDFSQIESDRPQVEVNQRFALFFAEQRPFFLEGQEIFAAATPANLVHTRTIVDPRFGAKLTGKIGRSTLGVFMADDEAPGRLDDRSDPAFGTTAQSFIGRWRYDLYGDSYLGTIASAREFGSEHDRVGGVDGRLRLGRTHAFSFTAVQSAHRDDSDGDLSGPLIEANLSRQARNLSYAVSHSRIDPDFRTGTGFVPRVDIQRTDANVRYLWWPEGAIINWGPRFTYLRNHNHAGELEDEQFRGEIDMELIRNIRVGGGVSRDLERFNGIDFRKTGASFSGRISGRIVSVNVNANRGESIFFGDDPFLGRSTDGTISLFVRPTSRLRTELRTVFTRFVNPAADNAEIFDVKIYRWRATYQFTDRLLLRHILEHNTLSGKLGNNVLATYRVNSGTVFFIGYDDRYQQGNLIDDMDEGFFPTTRFERTNRAFFTKVSYLFRY